MKVLVIGATGPTGRLVVEQALAAGHQVRVAVRSPATAEMPEGVEKVTADVMHTQTLAEAAVGVDAVISSLGSALSRQPTTLFSQGTRNMIEAMHAAGVRRFLCVTGIGAGDSKGHGGFVYDHLVEPLLLHEIYLDKTRQEEVIRASDLDWTIVRPGQLTNGECTGEYRVLTDLTDVTVGSISRADVAGFLIARLDEKESFGQTYTLSY